MLLELAILKNFDSGTYKAGVQLVGSLTTYFDDIPVSRDIPTSALVVGNRVILAVPDDNPKDACVIVTWPQGSPGGAEVHGNEYHDPDFAEEAAFLSHKTRHQDGGADEISLAGLDGEPSTLTTHKNLTTGVHGLDSLLSFVKSWYHEDWISIDKWTSTVTGSGGYDWYSPADLRLKTGTTINSDSCFDTPQIGPLCLHCYNQQWYFKVQAGSSLLDSEVRLYGVISNAAKPPADTAKHVGWKIINGQIYASSADGTTEKTTDTGVSMASIWTIKELFIKITATQKAEFYIDGVLKATHNGAGDNMPGHYNGRFSFNIKNTVAADKQIAFYTFNWRT